MGNRHSVLIRVFALLSVAVLCKAQCGVQQLFGVGALCSVSSGGGTVSVDGTNHAANTCSSGVTSCTLSATYSSSDTGWAQVSFCTTGSCSSSPAGCTVTASDGTNSSYTQITGATLSSNAWNIWPFYIPNTASGSVTITFSITGGCNFYYGQVYYIAMKNSGGGYPLLDTSNSGNGVAGGSNTLSTSGNATYSTDLGIVNINANSLSFSGGGYSILDTSASNDHDATSSSLTAGSPSTATFNSGGNWFGSIVAFRSH